MTPTIDEILRIVLHHEERIAVLEEEVRVLKGEPPDPLEQGFLAFKQRCDAERGKGVG